eukprot:CAMPEP_0185023204 /NCGR_PEP_ID=MMETSP1103-20130426/5893_1 /TAXON_ID=36769 /ORGANISM="Paraphysomonas bandaiensis, Strain Caron Lab Isolate" /LENGTH=740 /DNA_ID=CAMNT_0027555681 /DNA_START=255 /DNA_END=2477 /DNA_ORIENTATION=+
MNYDLLNVSFEFPELPSFEQIRNSTVTFLKAIEGRIEGAVGYNHIDGGDTRNNSTSEDNLATYTNPIDPPPLTKPPPSKLQQLLGNSRRDPFNQEVVRTEDMGRDSNVERREHGESRKQSQHAVNEPGTIPSASTSPQQSKLQKLLGQKPVLDSGSGTGNRLSTPLSPTPNVSSTTGWSKLQKLLGRKHTEFPDAASDHKSTTRQQNMTLRAIPIEASISGQSKYHKLLSHNHTAVPDLSYDNTSPDNSVGFNCTKSFEPTCDMFPYVRYWKKTLKAEDCHRSPLYRLKLENMSASPQGDRYVVFQPDLGGWNNIRMAAETAMVFAIATGRILVMPPEINFYLLDKNPHGFNKSLFDKYLNLRKIVELVDMIPMREYIKRLVNSKFLNSTTDIDKFSRNGKHLWAFFEKSCYTRDYHPGRMYFGFNITRDPAHRFGTFNHDERMKKHASHNRLLVEYNRELDNQPCIYFPGDYREQYRILTHFYTYLFWADPHEEHLYKRIVRDRLHYLDSIFCGAGQVVKLLLAESQKIMNSEHGMCNSVYGRHNQSHLALESNVDGVSYKTCHDRVTLGGNVNVGPTYHAIHVRRGDFQYTNTRLSGEKIWNNIKHLLNSSVSKILYIATDEKDTSFFDSFKEEFEVRFLKDYTAKARLRKGEFNQNHLGMVEQIICANSHTFVGTPLSTFTGYITRMRGYYRDGRYSNTYYTMPNTMYQLHTHPELKGPFWAREFAPGHKDIDDDHL